jgi:hypothetical protein
VSRRKPPRKPPARKPPPLTELGKALRHRDADLRSAWEHDYSDAIRAALAGNAARLLDLLRAHKRPVAADALTDDDLDRLADFIEATAKRRPGGQRDAAVHEAFRLAEVIIEAIMSKMILGKVPTAVHKRAAARKRKVPTAVKERAVDRACAQIKRERGVEVDQESVLDLFNRSKKRRAP